MAAPANPPHLDRQPPLLLLPAQSYFDDEHLIFLDPITNEQHEFQFTPPVGHQWRCRGSSHGWLVFLDETPEVVVLHPLVGGTAGTRFNLAQLSALPQVTSFHPYAEHHNYVLDPEFVVPWEYCDFKVMRDSVIRKIVLSEIPQKRNPKFIALAIFHQSFRGSNLAFCINGQDRWTLVPGAFVADAVFIQGTVYAVNSSGGILRCDVSSNPPRVVERMEITGSDGNLRYLVPMPNGNRVLLVTRSFDLDGKTSGFKVYELDVPNKKWTRLQDLSDEALFVGGNSCSSSVDASDLPGFEVNCIYYTDDDGQRTYSEGLPGEHDIGVFRLNDGVLSKVEGDHNARLSRPNPTWWSMS